LDKKNQDFVLYLFDEKGRLIVLTTLDRSLTKQEFEMVEQNIKAYYYMFEGQKETFTKNSRI